jgi:hypothetical protein
MREYLSLRRAHLIWGTWLNEEFIVKADKADLDERLKKRRDKETADPSLGSG